MRERLLDHLQQTLKALLDAAGDGGELPDFALEVPRNPDHGDFACNAALLLARRLRQPPRAIAERLVEAGRDPRRVLVASGILCAISLLAWIAVPTLGLSAAALFTLGLFTAPLWPPASW